MQAWCTLHSVKLLPAEMFPLRCISSGRCLSLLMQQVTGFLWSANSAASLSILTQLMHKPNSSVLGLSKALSYAMPKLQTDRFLSTCEAVLCYWGKPDHHHSFELSLPWVAFATLSPCSFSCSLFTPGPPRAMPQHKVRGESNIYTC